AVILATIGLIVSIAWEQHQMAEARVKALQQQAVLAAQATPTASPSQIPSPAAASNAATRPLSDKQHEVRPQHHETLKSTVADLQFSNNKGGLVSVQLLNHRAEQGQFVQLNTDRSQAIGAITQNPNSWQDSRYDLSVDPGA